MLDNNAASLARWLAKLEKGQGQSIRLGLDRCQEVAKRLHCLPTCPTVVVGGTNGKGSTVATLTWLLTQSGLKVGSYTSPHLMHFQERIQLNGTPVTEKQICTAFEAIEAAKGEVPLTYFEWTTLAALWLFKNTTTTCDIIVLEVGLGGRLDAVNIVTPTLAVVTSIGHDHQEYLGTSLNAIAKEKAGIFRKGIPVVIGKTAAQPALLTAADTLGVQLSQEGRDFDILANQQWQNKHQKYTVPDNHLPPSSLSLALATYTILEKRLTSLRSLTTLMASLSGLSMVGRFYQFSYQNKTIICDAAHNPEGAMWLASKLKEKKMSGIVAVWSSLQDKAHDDMVSALKPFISRWFIGKLATVRSASIRQMQTVLTQLGVVCPQTYSSVADAFRAALLTEEKTIVVFGSFYSVSCVLNETNQYQEPLPFHGLVSVMHAAVPKPMPTGDNVHHE